MKSFTGGFPSDATSLHPDGGNFGFSDGSVKFLKNSINSWAFTTTTTPGFYNVSLPVGVTLYTATCASELAL